MWSLKRNAFFSQSLCLFCLHNYNTGSLDVTIAHAHNVLSLNPLNAEHFLNKKFKTRNHILLLLCSRTKPNVMCCVLKPFHICSRYVVIIIIIGLNQMKH